MPHSFTLFGQRQSVVVAARYTPTHVKLSNSPVIIIKNIEMTTNDRVYNVKEGNEGIRKGLNITRTKKSNKLLNFSAKQQIIHYEWKLCASKNNSFNEVSFIKNGSPLYRTSATVWLSSKLDCDLFPIQLHIHGLKCFICGCKIESVLYIGDFIMTVND